MSGNNDKQVRKALLAALLGNLKTAMARLRSEEWEMGNGQCLECCGINPGTAGFSYIPATEKGHAKDCKLAAVLAKNGYEVVYKESQ